MAKYRIINVKYWDDTYIINLDIEGKLLYLYLLTNTLTNIAGIYELNLNRIVFDTKIKEKTVLKLFEKFAKDGKIIYEQGWVIIVNFVKNQSLNTKVKKGIEEVINQLPKHIFEIVIERCKIAYDSLSIAYDIHKHKSNSNTNTNINPTAMGWGGCFLNGIDLKTEQGEYCFNVAYEFYEKKDKAIEKHVTTYRENIKTIEQHNKFITAIRNLKQENTPIKYIKNFSDFVLTHKPYIY